jgi:hypothetical protein
VRRDWSGVDGSSVFCRLGGRESLLLGSSGDGGPADKGEGLGPVGEAPGSAAITVHTAAAKGAHRYEHTIHR